MRPSSYQDIAWNGVRFQVPVGWQPAVIQRNYLLFEDQYMPVFAIKWQTITGHFSPERITKKLHNSLPKTTLTPWNIPANWKPALDRFVSQGFRWHNDTQRGRALLLFEKDHNKTFLLQFYDTDIEQGNDTLQILCSLANMEESALQTWSMYDIRAKLPGRFHLADHEFLAGRYTITLLDNDLRLSLLRFKPAATLLNEVTLHAFAAQLADRGTTWQDIDPYTVEGERTASKRARFLSKLRRIASDSRLRLWHIPEKNVLLGIIIEAKRPIDAGLLEECCANYSSS